MMEVKELQIIGKIVGAHGICGELKVFPLTSWPDRYLSLQRCFIDSATGVTEYPVEDSRLHGKKFVLLKLVGLDDRTAAEGFKGRMVHIPKSERMDVEEGTYYLDDMIGCHVVDGAGKELGTVIDFNEYGGSGLLVVKLTKGKKIDVPFVDQYVAHVTIDEQKIVLTDMWRGLLKMEEA